jgi:hypothetical protein
MCAALFDEPSPEEVDKMIEEVADKIFDYNMDLVAILMLETLKPLSSVYAPMGRFMVAPFLPVVGEASGRYLAAFQDKQNVEKLIRLLEDKGRENERKAAEARKEKKQGGGWRRYVPWLSGEEG